MSWVWFSGNFVKCVYITYICYMIYMHLKAFWDIYVYISQKESAWKRKEIVGKRLFQYSQLFLIQNCHSLYLLIIKSKNCHYVLRDSMSYSCRCFSGNVLFITVSYPGSMDHSRVPNDRDLHSASRPATIPCFLYCQSSQCPIACLDVHTAGPAPDCLLSEEQHGVTLLSRCSGGLIPL